MVIAEYKTQEVIPLLRYKPSKENKKSASTNPVPYNFEDEL